MRRWWTPEYRTERGTAFTVEGVSSAECPVSAITPRSMELLVVWLRARRVPGAAMFGSDLSRWPAVMVDAWETLEIEQARYEQARMDAELSEAKQR